MSWHRSPDDRSWKWRRPSARPQPGGEERRRALMSRGMNAGTFIRKALRRATPRATAYSCGRVVLRSKGDRRRSLRSNSLRMTGPTGCGSRIGRTITAPVETDTRPVRFAFISCQNANQGAQNAYRRMIFEDERAREQDRLGFVLHLGDFIYEIVWYPEDRPQGMYDRRLRDIVRYEHGEKIVDC